MWTLSASNAGNIELTASLLYNAVSQTTIPGAASGRNLRRLLLVDRNAELGYYPQKLL